MHTNGYKNKLENLCSTLLSQQNIKIHKIFTVSFWCHNFTIVFLRITIKNTTNNNNSRIRVPYFQFKRALQPDGQKSRCLNQNSDRTQHFLSASTTRHTARCSLGLSLRQWSEALCESGVRSPGTPQCSKNRGIVMKDPWLWMKNWLWQPCDWHYELSSLSVFGPVTYPTCCTAAGNKASIETHCPGMLAAGTQFQNQLVNVVLTSWVTSWSKSQPGELRPPPALSEPPTCLRSTSFS